jgi:TonB family protein
MMEKLARSLVHHAARRAPGALSERLKEEWLADMSERTEGFSRLRFALGCLWATSIIAREHGAAVPAVSAAVAPASLGGYIQMGPAYSPRRTVTFILVASLHAAVLGGLMLGLTAKYIKVTPQKFQTVIIDQPRPPLEAPTLARPDITNTVIEVQPPPDLRFEADPIIPRLVVPEGDSTGAGAMAPPQDPPPHVVKRVQGAPGVGFPTASEYYPDADIRRGRQGNAAVSVCVDARGRLTSSPSILQSSGSATLDQAALRLAKAGSGHYQPSKEDGRPVDSCYGFLIQFILK